MNIQTNVDEFVESLKHIKVVAHYTCGYTPETMRTMKTFEYDGDLIEIAMHVWSDLRRFNEKMFAWDKDVTTGVKMQVKGLMSYDPRLIAIRDKILEYVQLFNRKSNPQWN